MRSKAALCLILIVIGAGVMRSDADGGDEGAKIPTELKVHILDPMYDDTADLLSFQIAMLTKVDERAYYYFRGAAFVQRRMAYDIEVSDDGRIVTIDLTFPKPTSGRAARTQEGGFRSEGDSVELPFIFNCALQLPIDCVGFPRFEEPRGTRRLRVKLAWSIETMREFERRRVNKLRGYRPKVDAIVNEWQKIAIGESVRYVTFGSDKEKR